MTWAKFDDGFHDHPKIRAAWRAFPASVALYSMGITYCCRHLTDGVVPATFPETQFRRDRDEKAAIKALVDAELWVPVDDGWHLPNFLVYNDSREQVEAKRATNAANGRKGGKAKAQRLASESPSEPLASRQASAGQADCSRPDPTRPDLVVVSPSGETTTTAVVVDQLRAVPEWSNALDLGAKTACEILIEANRDVPWRELAAEAVASKLDPGPNSLRTPSPRQALDLRLADHRAGKRGGDYTPGRRGRATPRPVDSDLAARIKNYDDATIVDTGENHG